MLSVAEARTRILETLSPVEAENLPLERLVRRVLAAGVFADTDLPPFDNSSVDGFALHAADSAGAAPAAPRTLPVTADIRAGSYPAAPLESGRAARIMTGAALPPGADAVVMVEDTDFESRDPGAAAPPTVKVRKQVRAGDNVRRKGDDLRAGQRVLEAGTRLGAAHIGLLAMLGISSASVHRRPRLALLSSGDELLPVDAPLAPGKIRDANTYALAALAETAGAEVLRLGVAPDVQAEVQVRLERAAAEKADLIVSSAGVSVGASDYVRAALEQGGELSFWRVNVRPGKPLAFGRFHGIPFFGLPGNPVSAMVGFELFVRPALEKLSGASAQPRLRLTARLAEPLESDGRESYLRAVVEQESGASIARLAGHQGSGDLYSLARANALLIVPSGVKSLPAGSEVEIWPIA